MNFDTESLLDGITFVVVIVFLFLSEISCLLIYVYLKWFKNSLWNCMNKLPPNWPKPDNIILHTTHPLIKRFLSRFFFFFYFFKTSNFFFFFLRPELSLKRSFDLKFDSWQLQKCNGFKSWKRSPFDSIIGNCQFCREQFGEGFVFFFWFSFWKLSNAFKKYLKN